MNILKNYHRELFEKWSFYKNRRFVFEGETPGADEAAEKAAESADAKKTEPATPLTDEGFDVHQKKYNEHITALAKANPKKAEAHKAEFDKELARIRAEYQTRLDALENIEGAEKIAADKVEQKVENLLTAINKRITEEKPAGEEASTEEKAGEEAGEGDKEKAPELNTKKTLNLITEKFGITEPVLKKMINELIPSLNLTPEQLTQIERGALELTPEQTKQIRDALPPKLFQYDSARGEMIHNQLTNDSITTKLEPPLSDKAADIIDDLFDDDTDPLRLYLVQRYDFRVSEGGGLVITKDDGEKRKISSVKTLITFLPKSAQANFQKLLALKDNDEPGPLEAELARNGTDGLKTLEAFQKLQAHLTNPENLNRPGFMDVIGKISGLFQLFTAILKAFKEGDMETVGDYFNSLGNPPDPLNIGKKLDASKESYKKALEKPEPKPTLSNLLKAYLEPRGNDAKELFCKGMTATEIGASPLGRFRMEARPAISEHLTKELSLNAIQNIAKLENGMTDITAFSKEGQKISIELNLGKEPIQARVRKYETKTTKNADGAEVTTDTKRAEVPTDRFTELKNGMTDLIKIIDAETGETSGETPEKEAEKPKKPDGVKNEYYEINEEGEMVLNEKVDPISIDKILEENIKTVVIKPKEGDAVTAVRSGNTFKTVSGKAVKISQGDIIVSTSTEEPKAAASKP